MCVKRYVTKLKSLKTLNVANGSLFVRECMNKQYYSYLISICFMWYLILTYLLGTIFFFLAHSDHNLVALCPGYIFHWIVAAAAIS